MQSYETSRALIASGRWSELLPITTTPSTPIEVAVTQCQQLSRDIMMRSPFTQEMFEAVERMIGPLTSWNVLTLMNRCQPSWSAIEFLMERGIIDVHSPEYSIMSYFMFDPIPWHIRVQTMNKLLEKGADINEQDSYGATLLIKFFRACRNSPRYITDAMSIIHFLLEKGADPLLTDKQGRLPLDFIIPTTFCSTDHFYIKQMLAEHS